MVPRNSWWAPLGAVVLLLAIVNRFEVGGYCVWLLMKAKLSPACICTAAGAVWGGESGGILNIEAYCRHQNLYISLFSPTICGPFYYGPP